MRFDYLAYLFAYGYVVHCYVNDSRHSEEVKKKKFFFVLIFRQVSIAFSKKMAVK